jgi:hypothetical protein
MRRTSLEAYQEIVENGLLSKRRLQVYQILFKYGPLTGGQILQIAKSKIPIGNSGTITTRLSELRRQGAIKEVGEINCPISGYKSILWDVTNDIPVKLEMKKTRKEKKNEIVKELHEIIDNLHNRDIFTDSRESLRGITRRIQEDL